MSYKTRQRRNKKVPTKLNPYTGKYERITRNPLAPIRSDPRKRRSNTIGGMRKRRTTPGAPIPFSYGWEPVYRKGV